MKKRYSYDAWGRPRNPTTWELYTVNSNNAASNLNAMQPMFDRGYTGHEHMAGFGLINMNGRVYDPYLQRFLSPDPFIQAPGNAQNYNRYSYVLNNPLMYTDPSGYISNWAEFNTIVNQLWNSAFGGSWSESGGMHFYGSEGEAKHAGFAYKRMFGGGGGSGPGSRSGSSLYVGNMHRMVGFAGRFMQWLGLGEYTPNINNGIVGAFRFIYSSSNLSGMSYDGGDGDEAPFRTHYIYEESTPLIYYNTRSALKRHPEWRLLTYNGGGPAAKRNRYNALKNHPRCWVSQSRDEFPYASTEEGGEGANVVCVPISEQYIQAAQLRALYYGMNGGEKFNIVLVPKGEPDPVPNLKPIPSPSTYPIPFPILPCAPIPIPIPIFL